MLSLRGADSEHIMQTEALCVCGAERACVLEREIRLIKNQEREKKKQKKTSQTVRRIS